MTDVGIITEQGDLGLGFDMLNGQDQKAYAEATSQDKNKDVAINDSNK